MPLHFVLVGGRAISDFSVRNDSSAIPGYFLVIQATLQYCFVIVRVCEAAYRCLFFLAVTREEWNLTPADYSFRGWRRLMWFEVLVFGLRHCCIINDVNCKPTHTAIAAITNVEFRCLLLVWVGAVDMAIIWIASRSRAYSKPIHQVLYVHKVVGGDQKWGNVFLLVIRLRNIGWMLEKSCYSMLILIDK